MSEQTADGLLGLVRKFNGVKLQCTDTFGNFAKFYVEGKQVGFIRSEFLEHLQKFPDIFIFKKSTGSPNCQEVHLTDDLKTPSERTDKVDAVLRKLQSDDALNVLRGWRNEKFDVSRAFNGKKLLSIERSATGIFGVLQYGTHINGYTVGENGQMMMWIARRSPTKPTFPGKLDNLCAGGLGSGLDARTCAIKECQEEASLSSKHLENLKPVGSTSYFFEDERGLCPETQFVFDLELPPDFTPVNADGEVDSFQLVSIPEVKQLIVGEDFKPNCALVILDFLIRWGFVTPDTDNSMLFILECQFVDRPVYRTKLPRVDREYTFSAPNNIQLDVMAFNKIISLCTGLL